MTSWNKSRNHKRGFTYAASPFIHWLRDRERTRSVSRTAWITDNHHLPRPSSTTSRGRKSAGTSWMERPLGCFERNFALLLRLLLLPPFIFLLLPCLALHCPALPCPALPCPTLPLHALRCPVLHLLCAVLPCTTLSCPALPTLPWPALSCPTLAWSALPCADSLSCHPPRCLFVTDAVHSGKIFALCLSSSFFCIFLLF